MDLSGLNFIADQILAYARDYQRHGGRVLPLGEAYLPLYESNYFYNGALVLHEKDGILHLTGFDCKANDLKTLKKHRFHVVIQLVPHSQRWLLARDRSSGMKRTRSVESERLRYNNLIMVDAKTLDSNQAQAEIRLLVAVYLTRQGVLPTDIAFPLYSSYVKEYLQKEPNTVAFMRLLGGFSIPRNWLALRHYIRASERSETSKWPVELLNVLGEVGADTHPRTIYNWLKLGKVPCKRNGIRYILDESTLRAIRHKLVQQKKLKQLVQLATPPGQKRKSTMRWIQRLRKKGLTEDEIIQSLIERAARIHNISLVIDR